jgi:hypothetical protein
MTDAGRRMSAATAPVKLTAGPPIKRCTDRVARTVRVARTREARPVAPVAERQIPAEAYCLLASSVAYVRIRVVVKAI